MCSFANCLNREAKLPFLSYNSGENLFPTIIQSSILNHRYLKHFPMENLVLLFPLICTFVHSLCRFLGQVFTCDTLTCFIFSTLLLDKSTKGDLPSLTPMLTIRSISEDIVVISKIHTHRHPRSCAYGGIIGGEAILNHFPATHEYGLVMA